MNPQDRAAAAQTAARRDENDTIPLRVREQAAQALEASGLALWDYDVTTGAVYLNEAWSEMLGAPRAPTVTTIADLYPMIPEEERPRVKAAFVAALKGDCREYRVDHRVRTPSGKILWVNSWGRVIERDAQGRALRMLGTNRDVTEGKHAEEALSESEARFRSAFKNSAIGMALLDFDGNWLMVNDALCGIVDCSEGELLRTDYRSVTHPEDRAADLEFLHARVTHGAKGSLQKERRFVRKDGGAVWVQINLSVVSNPGGEPHQVVAHIQDITERKAAEAMAEHLALHDPLTALPNKRLLSDRLAIALSAAKRSNTRIGAIFIDLDAFKPVNDRWGHTAGDAVLRQIAQRLQSALRQSDTVARVGGDEFIALVTGVEERAEIDRLAARLLAAIERPCEIESGTASVSASLGIAVFPDDCADAEELVRRADAAMYEAKRARAVR